MAEIIVYDALTALLELVVPNDKVKSDSADPSNGYLDSKVDGTTISVNASTHKLEVNATFVSTIITQTIFDSIVKRGIVALIAGIRTVTFTTPFALAETYSLQITAYRLDGSMTFPIIDFASSDHTKFKINCPDDCTLHYTATKI